MVSVYDVGNEAFDKLGDAVLVPTEGKMTHVGGGSYNLTMTHPIDPWDKWTHLREGAVLRIPVPKETIENAFAGMDAYIYKTNGETAIREAASEPAPVSYNEWTLSTIYQVGDKVTISGKNYKCVYFDDSSGQRFIPPFDSHWWQEISGTTGGSPAVATVGAGTELYWVSGTSSETWWEVETWYGIQGYVKKSQLTYVKHLTPSETEARVIETQLFRITKVTIETDSQAVSVEADHVSYDHAGNMVKEATISKASPAKAIYKITQNLMMDIKGTIATNLDADDCGTYTATIKGKNPIYCLLDPDNGVAGCFDAAVKRDNWDIFILTKTDTNRGLRLKYKKNIRGINWSRDISSLVTRVVPVAKDEKGDELYLSDPFVDSPHINDFPVIKIEKLSVSGQVGKDDGTETETVWTEAALLEEMQTKAEERFSVDRADEVAHEITVDFTAIGSTAEYPWLKDLETALVYDIVTAEDERLGLNVEMRVTEMEWDFVAEKITALVLSNVNNYGGGTVSGYSVQNGSITAEKLAADVLENAVNESVGIMPEYTGNTAVIDNLNSTDGTVALSANQGRILNANKLNVSAIKSKTVTGTTSSAGNLEIDRDIPRNAIVIEAYDATAAGNYMAMPFRQNAKKYVHVMLWDNTQAAVVNTSVSIGIDYVEL